MMHEEQEGGRQKGKGEKEEEKEWKIRWRGLRGGE